MKFLGEAALKEVFAIIKKALNQKADSSTTLSGYGITDAYTKTEVDNKSVSYGNDNLRVRMNYVNLLTRKNSPKTIFKQ